jgi:hypothetical protein
VVAHLVSLASKSTKTQDLWKYGALVAAPASINIVAVSMLSVLVHTPLIRSPKQANILPPTFQLSSSVAGPAAVEPANTEHI